MSTDKHKALPINTDLREYANKMRKKQTAEERKIWFGYLRYLKPNFHRQRIIGNYIVDFYCPKLNLIVEIDGCQHNLDKEYDDERTKYLEKLGFSVIRIENQDVNYDYNYAIFKIREACEKKSKELNIEFIDKTLEW